LIYSFCRKNTLRNRNLLIGMEKWRFARAVSSGRRQGKSTWDKTAEFLALLEKIHAALYAQAKTRLDDNIKIGITECVENYCAAATGPFAPCLFMVRPV